MRKTNLRSLKRNGMNYLKQIITSWKRKPKKRKLNTRKKCRNGVRNSTLAKSIRKDHDPRRKEEMMMKKKLSHKKVKVTKRSIQVLRKAKRRRKTRKLRRKMQEKIQGRRKIKLKNPRSEMIWSTEILMNYEINIKYIKIYKNYVWSLYT